MFSFLLATSDEARQMDKKTIELFDVPARLLMEVAGAGAAEVIRKETQQGSRALIFCGKGNNAGDALVVARFLSQNEISVTVVFVGGTDNLSPEAQVNFDILKKLQQSSSGEIIIHENLPRLNSIPSHDLIIDGMLGVGLKNEVRKPFDEVIGFINSLKVPVYAMDLPTGLHADNGNILGCCVRAAKTISFGTRKLGCYLGEGPEMCGTVILCDLGFPLTFKADIKRYVIDESWVEKRIFPERKPKHKYEAGNVYVIAGSRGLTGAAVMAAESAWAGGLGSVSVVCPAGLIDIFETRLVHQTKFAVGSDDDTIFRSAHLDEILEHTNRRDGTIVLGPGLGRDDDTLEFVRKFLCTYEGRVVADADALTALASDSGIFPDITSDLILTPHPGELQNLLKTDISDSFKRMIAAEEFAQTHRFHLLSKGLPVILCTPGGGSYITNYDTTVFSRTGFGDILAGKIAAQWELTGDPVYSCSKALLDGKLRYDRHIEHFSTPPEPLDLI